MTKCDRGRGSKFVKNSVTYFMDGPLQRDSLARCRGGVAIFVRKEYAAIEVPINGGTRTL